MSKVLDLLKEKNFYLEKFLEESKKERNQFKARRFESLQSLYEKREKILYSIQSIDVKINKICKNRSFEIFKPSKEERNDSTPAKNQIQCFRYCSGGFTDHILYRK